MLDFIGIGAHKSATTWLSQIFRTHPDVWVPPNKELHYFDRHRKYPSPSDLQIEALRARMFSANGSEWRRLAIRNLTGSVRKLDFERLHWWWKFYPKNYNDNWYKHLFEGNKELLSGEITPAYSILDIEDVIHIRKLFPDLKVIYIIRNPIERAWSHIRYDAQLGKITDLNNTDEVIRYLESDGVTKRGDYITTINRWTSVFSEENIFIGYFDDIQNNPELFLKPLCKFLGISNDKFPIQKISESVGASKKTNTIPHEVAAYLVDRYLDDLVTLSEMLGGHTLEWYKSARDYEQ